MADGIIDVQYPLVRNAIEELAGQTRQIINTLNILEDELQPLVRSWEGADRSMYVQVQSEWDQACKNMAGLLGNSSELVSLIHDNHSRDEMNSANNWGNISPA
ncbi:WXG100 family type VII secretion target [Streptomyces marokkonensis]|uniref:WXG100 family type VII secretion target n=1 Tax=Streptomyces marokkonensis TaxID=324855 RepID=A0ABW6QEB8_9ACTN